MPLKTQIVYRTYKRNSLKIGLQVCGFGADVKRQPRSKHSQMGITNHPLADRCGGPGLNVGISVASIEPALLCHVDHAAENGRYCVEPLLPESLHILNW